MAGTVFGKETGMTNKELEATIASAEAELAKLDSVVDAIAEVLAVTLDASSDTYTANRYRKGLDRLAPEFVAARASYDLGHQRANAKREEMIGLLREWLAAKSNQYRYVDDSCVVGIEISEIRSFLARLDQPAGDE